MGDSQEVAASSAHLAACALAGERVGEGVGERVGVERRLQLQLLVALPIRGGPRVRGACC